MRYLLSFFENSKVSIFDPNWVKLLPEELTVITQDGEFTLKRSNELEKSTGHAVDISNLMNCIQICYHQHTPDEHNGDVLADGEPDYIGFDIHFVKTNSGDSANPDNLKLNIDLTYGDHMQYEFTIEKPNKVKVHHYTGKNSLFDTQTYWGFSDESLSKLVEFFNRFGFTTTPDDYKFMDKDPYSYKYEIDLPKGSIEDMTKSNSPDVKELRDKMLITNVVENYSQFLKRINF